MSSNNNDEFEMRRILMEYRLALLNLQNLIALHKEMGWDTATPDLQEAAREVAELNARAKEWVDA